MSTGTGHGCGGPARTVRSTERAGGSPAPKDSSHHVMPAASSSAKMVWRRSIGTLSKNPRQTMSMSGAALRASSAERVLATAAGSGMPGTARPPGSKSGKQPWWRAARTRGRRCGQRHATHTGKGSWSGRGRNGALSTERRVAVMCTSSPDQNFRRRSKDSSTICARAVRSLSSPENELNSLQPSSPSPTPTTRCLGSASSANGGRKRPNRRAVLMTLPPAVASASAMKTAYGELCLRLARVLILSPVVWPVRASSALVGLAASGRDCRSLEAELALDGDEMARAGSRRSSSGARVGPSRSSVAVRRAIASRPIGQPGSRTAGQPGTCGATAHRRAGLSSPS